MEATYEIGRINGKPYKLRHDQRKNQHACDPEYRNEWRWFAWIDGDYQGDFRLKSEAIKHIKES